MPEPIMRRTIGGVTARAVARARVGMRPGMAVAPDPRRPGTSLVLVECWCGRAYTLTGEAVKRHAAEKSAPCPNADCGRGAE